MVSYLGEIRMFAGTFAPVGWANCDGRLLPIDEFSALFQLIGTTYGGDGATTFALPDLRGRAPVHRADQLPIGERGGSEAVTLTQDTMPRHEHVFNATTALARQPTPGGNTVAQSGTMSWYTEDAPSSPLAPAALSRAGGGQPHDNMHPYLAVSYIIALDGIYPPRQ